MNLANIVVKGTRPNHAEHNSLADAFNGKILSGLGDCAWRIFYYAYSTFRGVRNPNAGATPPQDEWFKFYGNIQPKMSYARMSWPLVYAGGPEGANVANPFLTWIFGNAGRVAAPNGKKDETYTQIHGYWSEPARLAGLEVPTPASRAGRLPEYPYGDLILNTVWNDSEFQRGCVAYIKDYKYTSSIPQQQATSGKKELQLLSLGIVAAARKHLRFVMESPSLGRYAPSFVPSNGVGGVFRKKNAAKDQIGQAMFYYLSYFRGSEDEIAKHNLTGNDVTTSGFDFETFFSKQFLLAPNYSSPRFEKDDNGSVKKDDLGNSKIRYDATGYPELYPESLSLKWSFELPKAEELNYVKTAHDNSFLFKRDQVLEFDTNPNPSHDLDRFCLSAILIQTSDIASKYESTSEVLLVGLMIDMYLNGKLYETIPISSDFKYRADRTAGQANEEYKAKYLQYQTYQFNKIHYFQYPVKGKVSFRVRGTQDVTGPSVTNHGYVQLGLRIQNPDLLTKFTILIKFAHVLEMKPSAADAYVVMRVASTEGLGIKIGDMDPVGHFNSDTAKKVFTNYMKYGVAYNLSNEYLTNNDIYISANPIYESARKFISSHVKMTDRYSLVDYGIKGNISILYFKRYSHGMRNMGIDSFRGIGPSVTPVGNRNMRGSATETFIPITQGQHYIVLDPTGGGYIEYVLGGKLTTFKHRSVFRGGNYHYASYFSNLTVGIYEIDGIISKKDIASTGLSKITVDGVEQPSLGAITNEWSMFMSYNLYHWSNSSAWKPDMYGDIMGALNARCLTSSYALESYAKTSKNVKLHLANVSWRQHDKPLVVESPSAYNYIEKANSNLKFAEWKEQKDYIKEFTKSCRVYEKPYEIVSVTRVNKFDPKSDVIKVVLNRRLKNNDGPYIGGNFGDPGNAESWRKLMLTKGENTRSDENAIISYLLSMGIAHCKKEVIGDVALDNQGFWTGHRPWGCCYPRFYFVKLIPYVSSGSIMYSDHYRQMEYYLRAMSNGFTNPNTQMSLGAVRTMIETQNRASNSVGGYDTAIGDYLFEDLMIDSDDNSNVNRLAVRPNMSP